MIGNVTLIFYFHYSDKCLSFLSFVSWNRWQKHTYTHTLNSQKLKNKDFATCAFQLNLKTTQHKLIKNFFIPVCLELYTCTSDATHICCTFFSIQYCHLPTWKTSFKSRINKICLIRLLSNWVLTKDYFELFFKARQCGQRTKCISALNCICLFRFNSTFISYFNTWNFLLFLPIHLDDTLASHSRAHKPWSAEVQECSIVGPAWGAVVI